MKDRLIPLIEHALDTLRDNGTLPGDARPPVQIDRTKDKSHGDFATNIALMLAKPAGLKPRDLAQSLIEALPDDPAVAKVEIAGPGFINFFQAAQWLNGQLEAALDDPYLAVPRPQHAQTVVVDYSSPNLAKEMHVGHLRSTIIGDAVVRTLSFLGHKVPGGHGTAQALPEQHQRGALQAARSRQPVQAQLDIGLGALQIRIPLGQAVTPVVEQEDVISPLRQPVHVHQMGADVLGIAVQEIDRPAGGAPGGQPPAVDTQAVGVYQHHVFIVEALAGRVLDPGLHGVEEQAAATLEKQGQTNGRNQSKYHRHCTLNSVSPSPRQPSRSSEARRPCSRARAYCTAKVERWRYTSLLK